MGALVVFNYLDSVPVSLNTKNISIIKVSSGSGDISVEKKGDNFLFRAPKNSMVSVDYVGISGFDSGSRSFSIGVTPKTIKLEPYYSQDRLRGLLINELPLITNVLRSKISGISDYKITKPVLYHYGEWSSVQLERKGLYSSNSDTLSVVLYKEDSSAWRIAASPDILFFYKNYPKIPTDILDQVNNR